MHCHEAKLRLNQFQSQPDKLAFDTELLAHVNECPNCQLIVQADRSLAKAFTELGQQEISQAPFFEAMVTRVEALTAESSIPIITNNKEIIEKKENTYMSKIIKQINRRPSVSLSIGLVGLLLLLSMLVPFSYQDSIGYEVAFAGVDKNLALDEFKLQELLTKLGIEDAVIDVTGCESTCNVKFSEISSEDDTKLLMAAFEQIGNNIILEAPKVTFETKDGNLFTSVLHEITEGDERHEFVFFGGDDNVKEKLQNVVMELLGGEDEMKTIWFMGNCDDSNALELTGQEGEMIFFSNCDTNGEPGALIEILEGADFGGEAFETLKELHEGHEVMDAKGNVMTFKAKGINESGNITMGSSDNSWTVSFREGEIDQESIDALIAAGVNVKIIDIAEFGNTDDDDESMAKESSLPEGYALSQNYPNPFNPNTKIDFSIAQAGQVTLEVYNIRGQLVTSLLDTYMSAGDHTTQWDATNSNGQAVASGIYLYRLIAGEVTSTKKMNLVK